MRPSSASVEKEKPQSGLFASPEKGDPDAEKVDRLPEESNDSLRMEDNNTQSQQSQRKVRSMPASVEHEQPQGGTLVSPEKHDPDAEELRSCTEEVDRVSEEINDSSRMEDNNSSDRADTETLIKQLIKEQLAQEGIVDKCCLPKDTYTLMMKAKSIFSMPWVFGILVWVIQIAFATLIFIHQFKSGLNSSPFDIPLRIDWEVRVGQCICLFFAFANINDIYESTHTISHARNSDIDITFIWIPNLLKLIQAVAVAGVTLILIISLDDLISLLANFAGLTFISEIDDRVYEMAKNDCLGRRMKDALGQNQPKTGTHFGIYQRLIMIPLFLCLFGPFIYFAINEESYFYAKYPNCLISPSDIYKFGDGKCDGGMLNTIQCNFDGGDCINFNREYKGGCTALDAYLVGNGECNEHLNTLECGYDGGDCCEKHETLKSKKPITSFREFLSEGCNPAFNTDRCLEDYGRCSEFNKEFKTCNHEDVATNLLNLGLHKKNLWSIYNNSHCIEKTADNVTICLEVAKYPNCTSKTFRESNSCGFFNGTCHMGFDTGTGGPVGGGAHRLIILGVYISLIILGVGAVLLFLRNRLRDDDEETFLHGQAQQYI